MNIEDVLKFEDKEQDRFLNEFFHIDEVRFYLGKDINDSQYQTVRSETKKGIKKGLEEFIENNSPKLKSIYLGDWHIVSEFYWDKTVEKKVIENLSKIDFVDKKCVEEYSDEVCGTYVQFLYQKSYRKFKDN